METTSFNRIYVYSECNWIIMMAFNKIKDLNNTMDDSPITCNEQDLIFASLYSAGVFGFYITIFCGGIALGKITSTVWTSIKRKGRLSSLHGLAFV